MCFVEKACLYKIFGGVVDDSSRHQFTVLQQNTVTGAEVSLGSSKKQLV